MIQKKVCMLGSFAVGKTSLVQRFVKSIFSDKYLSTVGVKIDKKIVTVNGQEINLVLWDLAGEDEFLTVKMSYLRGSSGLFIVADGTRQNTLDKAFELRERVEAELGKIPFILLINKADLMNEWEITQESLADLSTQGYYTLKTSAKTGEGVESAFTELVKKMLEV